MAQVCVLLSCLSCQGTDSDFNLEVLLEINGGTAGSYITKLFFIMVAIYKYYFSLSSIIHMQLLDRTL